MYSIVVAVGKNNEIGKNNQLLWHIPEDLKKFKEITTGQTVIMGRHTYESIGKPLPNRKNIVFSKSFFSITEEKNRYETKTTKLKICNDFYKFVKQYENVEEEIFIIGGEQIYKKSLELEIVSKIYMSYIDFSDTTADAYFPEIELDKWITLTEENYDGWKFCIYEKINR